MRREEKDIKRTKIVTTIGPASEDYATMKKLVENGANVIRLNFSHGDFKEHQGRIDNIKKIEKELNRVVGILLDTKGPEIRTGNFKSDTTLRKGNIVTITSDDIDGDENKFTTTYKDLYKDIPVGGQIMLDDGLIGLEVIKINGTDIECKILNTGVIKSKKGVNVPDADLNFEFLNEKDKKDLLFGIKNKVDYIAASFVRNANDVHEMRKFINDNGGEDILIISKIENKKAISNIDEIIQASDGIMVARGDLGIEIPAEIVPMNQKDIITKCNAFGKPVITATQMLETMQKNPRPTRAEVSDVANAILDGSDAVMLSGESAAGDFPVESVQMMKKIAMQIESTIDYDRNILINELNESFIQNDPKAESIASSVARTATNVNAKAIVTPTSSGFTAKLISKYRPSRLIMAVTPSREVAGKLTLCNGVVPLLGLDNKGSLEENLENAIKTTSEHLVVEKDDTLVIAAGIKAGKGNTNLMYLHKI